MRCALVLAVPLVFLGCGDDGASPGAGGSGGSSGPRETWVAATVTLPVRPELAGTLGFDLDGDGRLDNALGRVLAATVQAAGSGGIDLQGDVDQAVQAGALVQLVETRAGTRDTVIFRTGSPVLPACTDPADPTTCGMHLGGTASFQADPAGPALTGQGTADDIEAGPGPTTLQLAFFGGQTIALPLVNARASFHRSGDRLQGTVGGAIRMADVRAEILGSMQTWIATVVDRDCAEGTCVEGSTGATLLVLFDEDRDGQVSVAEVQSNALLTSLLAPDVDTDGDGTRDAISLGVGYELVGAVF
jgi:hypothetical protein